LTSLFSAHKISPESFDGFASVRAILPKEEVALLPGGLFAIQIERTQTSEPTGTRPTHKLTASHVVIPRLELSTTLAYCFPECGAQSESGGHVSSAVH